MNGHSRRSLGLVVQLAAALAGCSALAGTEPNGQELLQQLRARERSIADLSGRYEAQHTISDEFADGYAKTMRITSKEARERYDVRVIHEFAVRVRSGKVQELKHSQVLNRLGRRLSHRFIAFDGKENYSIPHLPEPDERRVAQVTIGRDVAPSFAKDCDYAIMMGLCLPDCVGTLSECAVRYGAAAPVPVRETGGAAYARLQFVRPATHEIPADRFTVDLDLDRALAPRRVRVESYLADSSRWAQLFEWDVEEFRQDNRSRIWYPVRARKTESAATGTAVASIAFNLVDLRFNRGLTAASFTSPLEDGSNVTDARTGRGYVYGGRPSKRIVRFLNQAADEARREVAANQAGTRVSVPQVKARREGGILIGVGVALLVAVAVWQWRTKQLTHS